EGGAAQQREDRLVGGEVQHAWASSSNREGRTVARTGIFGRFCGVRPTVATTMPVRSGGTTLRLRPWFRPGPEALPPAGRSRNEEARCARSDRRPKAATDPGLSRAA